MDLEAEIAYQKDAKELERVEPTTTAKLAEYRDAPRFRSDPLHALLKAVHDLKPETIYEFGCGAGEFTARFAALGYRIHAIDVSPELVDAARERCRLDGVLDRVELVTGDALTHRPPQPCDLVVAKLVLHHVDIEQALDAITASLKPDGTLVVWEPIARSGCLRALRDLTPVAKDVSPNERQLEDSDLEGIAARFERCTVRYFYLTARLQRLCPVPALRPMVRKWLLRIDALLLGLVPPLRRFAGAAVLVASRPKPHPVPPDDNDFAN